MSGGNSHHADDCNCPFCGDGPPEHPTDCTCPFCEGRGSPGRNSHPDDCTCGWCNSAGTDEHADDCECAYCSGVNHGNAHHPDDCECAYCSPKFQGHPDDCDCPWCGDPVNIASGEDHYRFNPDAHKDYGRDWEEIAERIRERDDRTCQRCDVPEDNLTRKLDVHHITPRHTFDSLEEANRESNLISLCRPCHTAVENGGRL